jgi:uncharacterized protein (TIGR03437 family)
MFDDRPAAVLYAGAAPGIVAGVVQVNFRVPADFLIESALQTPVRVAVSGPDSNLPAPSSASIFVTP